MPPPHQLEIFERTNNANNSSRHKPRSFSVSGDHTSNFQLYNHAYTYINLHCIGTLLNDDLYVGNIIGLGPLSPQSSCASSGSEGRLDDASNRSLASGMRGEFNTTLLLYNNREEGR